ncbi:DUF6677 family protein [Anaerobaca lacustris]|uniref:DUF6677 domain-containing protein n=1 Tax=Anaerobaca lacustris TaxID=3044600 RepID=A0AAW6TZA5_9BACT|nr:hypothetical protein [Sedimentisphaerales bacterium M17dextr]
MPQTWKDNHAFYLTVVGLLAWLVPGGGHFLLNERRRGIVILVTVVLTFLIGLYVGSIGIIDAVNAKPWYAAQLMNSPVVFFLGRISMSGHFPVYGRAGEIGQIYTSIAGLLNLLCIVNAIYTAHLRSLDEARA